MVDVTRLVLLDVRVLLRLVLVPMMVAVLLPVVAAMAVAVVVGVSALIAVKVELLVVEAVLVVLVPPSTSTALTLNDRPDDASPASSAACSICESDVTLVVSKISTTPAASLPGTRSS